MNDLRSFVALQARLYEFLEQQDEATLLAIVDRTAQLAVRRPGGSEATAYSGSGGTTDPLQVSHDLLSMVSEQERRNYLDDKRFTMKILQMVAKHWNLHGYSKLKKDPLVGRLARHGFPSTGGASTIESRLLATGSPDAIDENKQVEPRTRPYETSSPAAASSAETTTPSTDAAAIALRLRETETEDEGAAYLRALDLDKKSLLAVAGELLLTRVDRLSRKELERRVLEQAIGARRKFAGLRKW